ncbi:hypothetical protein IQ217_08265 [Synechocystis salina LEGE 00031]|jgi:hypothetical protein|uniref:Transcriptional regulator Rv0078-like C-terminal domain-containing protein n=2 Tax=Synechocystis TaxID=1142 RepID=A0ABR9VR62_9SYNC|nr:hypothetical protein [Synechocystis salina LEGE 00031]
MVVADRELKVVDAEGFAHLVNGSLNELAAWVAQSEDPQRLKTGQQLIEALLIQHQSRE